MGGLLVGLHPGRVAVNLKENESVRIVSLLDHVEPQVARFRQRQPGVFQSGRNELGTVLRFDVYVNTDGVHDGILRGRARICRSKPSSPPWA